MIAGRVDTSNLIEVFYVICSNHGRGVRYKVLALEQEKNTKTTLEDHRTGDYDCTNC